MSVPAAVSLDAVRAELADALPFAASAGLAVDTSSLSEENLRFYVTFRNCQGAEFYAEFDCGDYPLYPPYIEFVDAARERRGLQSLYPNVFHPTPCVCMRYSRKAYGERGGPHPDWRFVDWHLATPGGGAIETLAMVISDMLSKILGSTGRMGG